MYSDQTHKQTRGADDKSRLWGGWLRVSEKQASYLMSLIDWNRHSLSRSRSSDCLPCYNGSLQDDHMENCNEKSLNNPHIILINYCSFMKPKTA